MDPQCIIAVHYFLGGLAPQIRGPTDICPPTQSRSGWNQPQVPAQRCIELRANSQSTSVPHDDDSVHKPLHTESRNAALYDASPIPHSWRRGLRRRLQHHDQRMAHNVHPPRPRLSAPPHRLAGVHHRSGRARCTIARRSAPSPGSSYYSICARRRTRGLSDSNDSYPLVLN